MTMKRTLFWDPVEHADEYRFYWQKKPSNVPFVSDNWFGVVDPSYTVDADELLGPGVYSFSVSSVLAGIVSDPHQHETWRAVEFSVAEPKPDPIPPVVPRTWNKHMVHMCIGPVLNAMLTQGRKLTPDEWLILRSAVNNLYDGDPVAEIPPKKKGP